MMDFIKKNRSYMISELRESNFFSSQALSSFQTITSRMSIESILSEKVVCQFNTSKFNLKVVLRAPAEQDLNLSWH